MQTLAEADLRESLAALHPDCWGWALACCGRNRHDAEDVLQRAYLRILAGHARFRGTSLFRTFVFGVIRMIAREERRRIRFRLLAADVADLEPLPDARAVDAERRAQLLRALAKLSVRQREVLELVFYHDMTIEEAAAVMQIGIGSARTHYERAKTRLRTLLSKEFWHDG